MAYQITITTTEDGATATITRPGRKSPIAVASRAAGEHLPAPARAIFAALHGAGLAIRVGGAPTVEVCNGRGEVVAFDEASRRTLATYLRG